MGPSNIHGSLNVFQRAMLQWNDLHPYHAVHVMRLPGAPDPARLARVIQHRCDLHGLSCLRIDRSTGTFRYGGDRLPVQIRQAPRAESPRPSLESEIDRQLNQRFDSDQPFVPLRFFVLEEGDSFFLGTGYFHPIADAESVASLLQSLAGDYLTGRDTEAHNTLECHPPRHDRRLLLRPGVIARKLQALPSQIRTMRHSFRPRWVRGDDPANRVRLLRWDSGILNQLIGSARSWGVTVHDLLLALLMQALGPLTPERHQESRRRNISLGTIVNVRRDHAMVRSRTFGLFLGSFVVTHPVPEAIPLEQLAADLHRQTSRIKRRKLYLATPVDLRLASCLIALYSTPRQRTFYHKHHPLCGGITNLNMNTLWPADAAARPLDYLRSVSTGPVTPLVLSVTTFDDHMNVSITYRPAMFGEPDIDRLQAGLARPLGALGGGL